MYKDKKTVNNKILKLVFYTSFLLPLLILGRYLLGYRVIIFADLFLTFLLYINLIILKVKNNEDYNLYKISLISFLLIIISGLFLPGFEYLGLMKTLFADLLYLIPGIIFMSFYLYFYKKGFVNISD